VYCPHCGEPLESYVDPGGGERQEYVEDCAVCCRPIRFVAVFEPSLAGKRRSRGIIALPSAYRPSDNLRMPGALGRRRAVAREVRVQ
jgi:hypothetical protein